MNPTTIAEVLRDYDELTDDDRRAVRLLGGLGDAPLEDVALEALECATEWVRDLAEITGSSEAGQMAARGFGEIARRMSRRRRRMGSAGMGPRFA